MKYSLPCIQPPVFTREFFYKYITDPRVSPLALWGNTWEGKEGAKHFDQTLEEACIWEEWHSWNEGMEHETMEPKGEGEELIDKTIEGFDIPLPI